MLVIDNQTGTATGNEIEAIDAFNDSMEAAGQWITAGGLVGPAKAAVFDNRNDLGQVTEGSLFGTDEYYSGFWLINAESIEVARELAAAGSKACNRRVELRPLL